MKAKMAMRKKPEQLKPGEITRRVVTEDRGGETPESYNVWWVCAPNGAVGSLEGFVVREHDSGELDDEGNSIVTSITAMGDVVVGKGGKTWVGRIERGEFIEGGA